ncbi:MAG TPA: L-serine ammonia-lyase, iron-sulfur-dependent, subunit alpha [Holophaga sp.]|nr:L-serine ammonia-lyase, iron-sulfur-dependent, subunit alpha [Holophaga sp.]
MGQNPGTLAAYRAAALERGVPLSAVFLEEEAAHSGRGPQDLERVMRERIRVMRQSAARGLGNPQMSRSGLIRGGAHRMAAWMDGGNALLGPAFSRLVATALAVAEVNACMGRIVAAPTAGACGVLPAALFTVADERGRDEDDLVRAFFTAGGIGLVIERLASLSGAEGGCQAEVGSASAMAAGGLVELLGGSPVQVDHAVAFALANVLGLVCDPVKGLVEVPCVYRNTMGAANAVAAAELALAGVESAFDADQVIETMGKIGRRIPEEFRETARGGLAALPSPVCDSCRGGCGGA